MIIIFNDMKGYYRFSWKYKMYRCRFVARFHGTSGVIPLEPWLWLCFTLFLTRLSTVDSLMTLKLESLNINLPFGLGGANIVVSKAQQNVAWALYVELATRVAGVELKPGMGSAREALNSLYSLFDTTRSVLREQGPGAAEGPESVGPIAIDILNQGLRPFLVKWHTSLGSFELRQAEEQRSRLGGEVTPVIDESAWPERDDFYRELEENRQGMLQYVQALARVAGIVIKGQSI